VTQPGWLDLHLGDVLRVKHGFAFKSEHFGTSGGFIVVTPGNFHEAGGFKRKSGQEKYYTSDPPPQFVLRQGDLIVAMTEQAEGLIGSSAIVPTDNLYLHNQRIGLIEITAPHLADKGFLYYLFNTRSVRAQLEATASGAKVRHTAPGRIEAVRAPLPPLAEQQRIAAILSAYDDLIEKNTRRIELLEEMAQAIYREWFVEFRFPGHEDVRMVESEMGPAPEGWRPVPLFSVVEPTFGFPFKSELFNEAGAGLPLIRIRDIPANSTGTYTTEDCPARYRVRDGDTLVGMDGDFHMCVWASGTALLNQRVVRLRPSDPGLSPYHVFLAMRRPIQELNGSIVGTTVAHLGKRHLAQLRFLVPVPEVAARATEILDPLMLLGISLRQQIQNLRQTRNLLLPRLISGEIDVSNLDVGATEPAA
jgi:type I restriction enzyme S subunit